MNLTSGGSAPIHTQIHMHTHNKNHAFKITHLVQSIPFFYILYKVIIIFLILNLSLSYINGR